MRGVSCPHLAEQVLAIAQEVRRPEGRVFCCVLESPSYCGAVGGLALLAWHLAQSAGENACLMRLPRVPCYHIACSQFQVSADTI